jgi:hypothetical protein
MSALISANKSGVRGALTIKVGPVALALFTGQGCSRQYFFGGGHLSILEAGAFLARFDNLCFIFLNESGLI